MIFAFALAGALLEIVSVSDVPLDVRDCSTGVVRSEMLYKTDGNYTIEFINVSAQNISAIGFVVHLGAQSILIKDEGMFAPGVNVKHRFVNRGGEVATLNDPPISCSVRWVRFSDGARWETDHS